MASEELAEEVAAGARGSHSRAETDSAVRKETDVAVEVPPLAAGPVEPAAAVVAAVAVAEDPTHKAKCT